MNKERLEKAKKILNHIKGYGVYDGNDDIEIFEWLIEQAERLQELRKRYLILTKENNQVNDELIDEFRKNKRYRELLEKIKEMTRYDDCREAEIYELVSDELEGEE